MNHEPHTSHEAPQDNFWTDIPEGSDMLPGSMPGMMPGGMPLQQLDDLYPTGHHATQQDEYGTGIDPHGPDTDTAYPGDDPAQMPRIEGRGDGSGMADFDSTDSTRNDAGEKFGDPNHLPGNYGRTAANAPDNAQDNTQDCGMDQDCRH